MAAALAAAKDAGGVLLIAKLDRLARNVHFVSGLMESGVEFTAVDMPTANRLTIHIMAAMAEFEAEQISKRTKEALAAAKRRGVKLGAHSHKKPGRGPAVNRAAARKAYRRRIAYIRDLQAQGMGHQAIATRLNAEGYTTRTGKPFHAMTVYRILQRDR
jgi:DNA invertase Pin-like site-specific DNA recombinase